MEGKRRHLNQLLSKAHCLPTTPGVYLMKDEKGLVIYVGKALSLKSRVSSYFQLATDLGFKKQQMLDVVADFEVLHCESEWEALLTENRLIKDIHPRFNARLTDDKTFPYLAVTMRDDFPGVFITREPGNERFRGAKILGPFTSSYALRESVQILQKVFRFRTCTLDIREDDPKRAFFRPCLLYPIKQCTAPCGAKVSKEAYRRDIDRFVRFLTGKRTAMLRELRQDMETASLALDFEEAAALRDQIKALEKLDHRGDKKDNWQPEAESLVQDPRKAMESLQRALKLDPETDGALRCMEAFDIAHLMGGETVASKVCFVDGRPLKDMYRRYKIKTAGNDDFQSMREVMTRRYRDAGKGDELYPDVILIDGGKGQLSAAMGIFQELDVQPPRVISLAKKEELIHATWLDEPVKLGRNNPGLKICMAIRDEAHRFAQHYHHILRRKKVLGIEGTVAKAKKLPRTDV